MTITLSSDHSAIYRDLHLHLDISIDLSLAIGLTRVDRKSKPNAIRASIQLLQLNTQARFINKI
jgi:hypothetical protein